MANCKLCGKEYVQRNVMQLFCSNKKDGPGNCKAKYRYIAEKQASKEKMIHDARVDELSLLSAQIFKGE
jgi:hypothetical protein